MSIVFALLAALSSAANLLTQRVSSGAGPSGSPWRLAMYLLRQPLWLLGAAAAVGSFLFQAAALHFGSLSVVQPVLVTELVFVLVIRRVWLRQQIRPAAWGSAGLTCVALAVFLAAAEPRGGTAGAAARAWVGAVSVCGGASVALTVLGIRGSPVRRAALYGTAAAIVAALAATFIKELTNVLSVDGPVAAVSSWPLYAVIVSGVASGLLVQAALHVGPLTVSQPLLAVIDPIATEPAARTGSAVARTPARATCPTRTPRPTPHPAGNRPTRRGPARLDPGARADRQAPSRRTQTAPPVTGVRRSAGCRAGGRGFWARVLGRGGWVGVVGSTGGEGVAAAGHRQANTEDREV